MTTTIDRKTLKQLARKVRIRRTYGAKMPYKDQTEWQRESTGWSCTLRYQGRQYTFDFWQGRALTGEPTVEGTLDCLLSDADCSQGTFEDFCGNVGYDTDSREAERIYKACQKVEKALRRLLGADYEAFLYADRD